VIWISERRLLLSPWLGQINRSPIQIQGCDNKGGLCSLLFRRPGGSSLTSFPALPWYEISMKSSFKGYLIERGEMSLKMGRQYYL
jgi:hypothetical protein